MIRREPRCAVCGRPVDGLDDARRSGKHWLCSPDHFLYWETRRRRGPRRRAGVGVLGGAAVAVAALWLGTSGVSTHRQPSALASLRDALRQMDYAHAHPLHLHVHLTPAAVVVADEFTYDEYSTHDCRAIAALTARLPGLEGISGPIPPAPCEEAMRFSRQNDEHLVHESRVLKHDCGGGLFQVALKANECYRFTIEGRYVTNSDGTKLAECDGAYVEVFLKPIDGHWRVVAQDEALTWGGGCSAKDVEYWQHREDWES